MNDLDRVKDTAEKIQSVMDMLDKSIGLENLSSLARQSDTVENSPELDRLRETIRSARKIYGNHLPIYHNTMPIYDSVLPALSYLQQERPRLFEQVCEVFDEEAVLCNSSCLEGLKEYIKSHGKEIVRLLLFLEFVVESLALASTYAPEEEQIYLDRLGHIITLLSISMQVIYTENNDRNPK